MAKLAAFGLTLRTPDGWDGEIYLPRDAPAALLGTEAMATAEATAAVAASQPVPILHVANFPLPMQRGDYGGGD